MYDRYVSWTFLVSICCWLLKKTLDETAFLWNEGNKNGMIKANQKNFTNIDQNLSIFLMNKLLSSVEKDAERRKERWC